jgi:hypothetical protein
MSQSKNSNIEFIFIDSMVIFNLLKWLFKLTSEILHFDSKIMIALTRRKVKYYSIIFYTFKFFKLSNSFDEDQLKQRRNLEQLIKKL